MTSLYIHIPFCKKKCNYCDFVSYAGKEELVEAYVDAVISEITALTLDPLMPMPPLPEGEELELKTIYFGGGTPTLLEPRHYEKLLSKFEISNSKLEISLEANPGTADKAKLEALRELGINRLSIGVQSFNDKHLRTLGRIHTSSEAIRSYEDARAAGFDNINLDLIFALPGQTLDEWQADLRTALNLKPNHLSTYNLQIEEGTPLHFQRTANSLQLPAEEEELAMYENTIETLTTNGYKHYEISNFARPGFECSHNINYWKNGNYIGLGAGAHSHVNGRRWANSNSIEAYIGNRPDVASEQVSSPSETLFLGLRLLEGLSTEKFAGFEKETAELIEDGLLCRQNGNFKLTRKGLYLGNLVFEKFV